MVVSFSGTRADISAKARQLADMLSGRAPDRHNIAKGFLLALGFGALIDIQDAFRTKADGGRDEMGIKWRKLSPITIAMRPKGVADAGKSFAQLAARDVKILRDTGILRNSLSPGILNGANYSKPNGPGGSEQVMDIGPGLARVGTNVSYASTHQHGDPSRNIPARPFLPRNPSDVPKKWVDRWGRIAAAALKLSLVALFQGGQT